MRAFAAAQRFLPAHSTAVDQHMRKQSPMHARQSTCHEPRSRALLFDEGCRRPGEQAPPIVDARVSLYVCVPQTISLGNTLCRPARVPWNKPAATHRHTCKPKACNPNMAAAALPHKL
jgi:hypothetical protein